MRVVPRENSLSRPGIYSIPGAFFIPIFRAAFIQKHAYHLIIIKPNVIDRQLNEVFIKCGKSPDGREYAGVTLV